MSRAPEHFEARVLRAKQVESKGGNRGFEHTPVSVPTEVQRQIEREIEALHHRYATAPREAGVDVEDGDGSDGVGLDEIETEIETAIDTALRSTAGSGKPVGGIEAEVAEAAEKAVIEVEIEQAITDATDG